jgi:hypothetical protein
MMVMLNNVWIFVTEALRHRVPLWQWGRAWRALNEIHRQNVHKDIWELKKQGRVIERDGRLYPNDKNNPG